METIFYISLTDVCVDIMLRFFLSTNCRFFFLNVFRTCRIDYFTEPRLNVLEGAGPARLMGPLLFLWPTWRGGAVDFVPANPIIHT